MSKTKTLQVTAKQQFNINKLTVFAHKINYNLKQENFYKRFFTTKNIQKYPNI